MLATSTEAVSVLGLILSCSTASLLDSVLLGSAHILSCWCCTLAALSSSSFKFCTVTSFNAFSSPSQGLVGFLDVEPILKPAHVVKGC